MVGVHGHVGIAQEHLQTHAALSCVGQGLGQWIARQQPLLLELVIDPLEELLDQRLAVREPVHPLGLAGELAPSDLAFDLVQRSDLAQKLIATQESTLRHISRELHDEFGQILTAVGAMLGRAEKHTPEGSPLRVELKEVRDITQTTLDNVRSLSQALHPVMLDEAGLETTVDWYLATVEKQTGTDISYEKSGVSFPLNGSASIHVYRVLQEALNNVARHSGARAAWVRLRFTGEDLELEVEDHGKGFGANTPKAGIGLVAMRERAELLGGSLEFRQPPAGGTLVRLRVPREKAELHAE